MKQTKYIIENPYSQQEFIDTIKNINTKDSRFSSIMYLDKDNIPKRFDTYLKCINGLL